jgi:hypothetical protein
VPKDESQSLKIVKGWMKQENTDGKKIEQEEHEALELQDIANFP